MNDADSTKGLEVARRLLQQEGLPESDENLFIAAACKEKGIAFLKGEAKLGVRKVDACPAASEPPVAAAAGTAAVGTAVTPSPATSIQPSPLAGPSEYTVRVNDREYFLAFEGNTVTVEGNIYHVDITPTGPSTPSAPSHNSGPSAAAATAAAKSSTSAAEEIAAQMPGVILRLLVSQGDRVQSGQSLLVMEAMKMEVPVATTVTGILEEFQVNVGDHVANGQILAKVAC